MQQHTGQHVLSAVVERAFGARTLSFHLGAESSTVDLDRELSPAQIGAAEEAANRVVWEDVPVTVRYASEEEARLLPLRKESVRTGTLRLVDVAGVDLSACGGTHVARTGALGQIAIASWERFKGGQRIEFLCGGRALLRFQQLRDTTAAAIRLLSVLPSELPAGIGRLQAELKEQKRLLGTAHTALAGFEAAALLQSAATFGPARLVCQIVDGDANRLKALAVVIAEQPDAAALLTSRSTPALIVVARGSGLAMSCRDVVAALTGAFGGRGGGKADLAQAGGLSGTPDDVLAAARALAVEQIR
jgi:alanyl-tRNA synthetase